MRHLSDIICNQYPLIMQQTEMVQGACRQMSELRTGSVLVIDDNGSLVGIFTGRDAVRVLADHRAAASKPLKDVMTPSPATMKPRSTAIEALRLMRDGGFRHVPVVEDDRVVGIVSRGDFRGLEHDRMDEETGLWERIG